MVMPFDAKVSVPPDVMVRQVGGESVLLDLKTERYFGLDDVSTRIWEVLTGAESVEAAYAILAEEFEVKGDELRRDLEEFVRELVRFGLVQLADR